MFKKGISFFNNNIDKISQFHKFDSSYFENHIKIEPIDKCSRGVCKDLKDIFYDWQLKRFDR